MICEKLTDNLVKQDIITEEKKAVYEYGIHQSLNYLITFLSVVVIGLWFDTLYEVVIFMITIYCLRIAGGGFHFERAYVCFLFSVILLIVFPPLMNLVLPLFSKPILFFVVWLLTFNKKYGVNRNSIIKTKDIIFLERRKRRILILVLVVYSFLYIVANRDSCKIICLSLTLNYLFNILQGFHRFK